MSTITNNCLTWSGTARCIGQLAEIIHVAYKFCGGLQINYSTKYILFSSKDLLSLKVRSTVTLGMWFTLGNLKKLRHLHGIVLLGFVKLPGGLLNLPWWLTMATYT